MAKPKPAVTKRFGYELRVLYVTKAKTGGAIIKKEWVVIGKDFGSPYLANKYAQDNYPGQKSHVQGVRVTAKAWQDDPRRDWDMDQAKAYQKRSAMSQ
ncbi:MAG: hypothetical protein ACREGB_03105 [Candidatus Saccharimonadales bacterium]